MGAIALLNYIVGMLKSCLGDFYFVLSDDRIKIFLEIMKIFSYIIIAFVVALIVLNITMLDFNNLFQGDSLIAIIGIVALLCAVCILLIYRTSKLIDEKTK